MKYCTTIEEFERVNELELFEMFESENEGTCTKDPDHFNDWLGNNIEQIYQDVCDEETWEPDNGWELNISPEDEPVKVSREVEFITDLVTNILWWKR